MVLDKTYPWLTYPATVNSAAHSVADYYYTNNNATDLFCGLVGGN